MPVHVNRHQAERVAVLELDWERENRFHPDFVAEIMEVLDQLEDDGDVGALVFTGRDPKFFCNGLDLAWVMAHVNQPEEVLGSMYKVNGLFKRVTLYPKPTIAALNGHTFGAGVFLAAHMDFRLMREDRGWVCMPESDIDIPLLPGMIAICQAVLGPKGFRHMYYTGRRYTGPEAVDLGFAESCHPRDELLSAAIELGAHLAPKKTRTYAEMKRRIRAEVARILDEEDPPLFAATLSFPLQA